MEPTTIEQQNPSGSRPMADILEELAKIREELDPLDEKVFLLKEYEASLKGYLREAMQAEGIRTGEAHGLKAQLKTRKSNVVTDVATLTASLNEAGVLDDHLVLNKPSAAKEAVKNGWEGAEVQETTYLAVSEVKS